MQNILKAPSQPTWNPKEAETNMVTVWTVLVPVETAAKRAEETCPQCCSGTEHNRPTACSVAKPSAERF